MLANDFRLLNRQEGICVILQAAKQARYRCTADGGGGILAADELYAI